MIDAADFLKWLNIFNVPYSGHPGSEVVISWNGSTNPVDVTAGSGIDITDGVISLTGTGASVAYATLTSSNYDTVISYTDTVTWKPLVGDILDSSGVNFVVGNDNPDDPTSPFFLQYVGDEESFFQIVASFSMRRFSSTTANGYYLSASRDGINPIDFTISDYQVDYGLDGQDTINSKCITYNIQLDLITNDKIYFVVRSATNTSSTDNDFLNTSNIISVQKVGDVGGTLAGVSSLNGETGDINLTSSGSSLTIIPSGTNINIDIKSPISISNGGTNKNSQYSNGINFFDGTSINSNSNFIFDGSNNVTLTNSSLSTQLHIVSNGSGNNEQILFTNNSGNTWSIGQINTDSSFRIIGPSGSGTPININSSGVINLSNLNASTILSLDSSRNMITTALSGDITSSGLITTLATVNSNIGSFGSSTQVGTFTVNGKGLITAASNVTISGVSPGGSAGGDLSGSYPNPTVSKINSVALGSTTASSGNLLIGSGTQWVTQAMSGDATISNSGVLTISANVVSNTKISERFGYSVMGNSTSSVTNVADLVCTAVGQVLRRDSTYLEFGSIDLSNSNTVGASILGISNGGTGTSSFVANGIIFQNSANTSFSSIGDFTYTSSSSSLSISTSNAAPSLTISTSTTGSGNSASMFLMRGDTANGTVSYNLGDAGINKWAISMYSPGGPYDGNVDDLVIRAATGGGGVGNVIYLNQSQGDVTCVQGNFIFGTATKGLQFTHAAVSGGTANSTLVTSVVLTAGSSGTINNSAITTSHIGFATPTSVSGTVTTNYSVTCGSGSFSVTGGSLDNSTLAVIFIKAL